MRKSLRILLGLTLLAIAQTPAVGQVALRPPRFDRARTPAELDSAVRDLPEIDVGESLVTPLADSARVTAHVRKWGGCVLIGLRNPSGVSSRDSSPVRDSSWLDGTVRVYRRPGVKGAVPADTVRAALRHLDSLGVELRGYLGAVGIVVGAIDPALTPTLMQDRYVEYVGASFVWRAEPPGSMNMVEIEHPDSSLTSRCSRRGRPA